MIKPHKIFFFCVIACLVSLMFVSCQNNAKTELSSSSNGGISTTEDEAPLNEEIKKIHDSHRGRCPKNSVAGMKIYNRSFEIIKWIEGKRGLKFKVFPPICALSKDDMLKIQSRFSTNGSLALDEISLQTDKGTDNDDNYSPGHYSDGKIVVERDHPLEITIIVHELTHALQDQNYNIDEFKNPEDTLISRDGSYARVAVLEGEATLMQLMYPTEGSGAHVLTKENAQKTIEKYIMEFERTGGNGTTNLLDIFLYKIGLRFILSLSYDSYDPNVLNTLFAYPPLSTDEVFFPQKYVDKKPFYAHSDFDTDLLDNFFSDHGFRNLKTNELAYGKLNLSMMIKEHVRSSDIFLKDLGWNGDRFLIYSKDQGKRIEGNAVLVHLCKWDSPEDAYYYASYLVEMVSGKTNNMENFEAVFESDEINEYSYTSLGKKRYIVIKVKNDRLIYVENLPDLMLANFRMLESQIFNFLKEDWVS